jgi:LPS-assembly lipoprotein
MSALAALRTMGLAGLAAAGLAALGGCGFTPLYANAGPTEGLTHIRVDAAQGRAGYLIGQDLEGSLGVNQSDPPVYKLDFTETEGVAGHGLNAIDVSQRFEVDMTVNYTLTDIATGKVVHSGKVVSIASYDSAAQPYAGIAARQDTESRVASDAAQQMQVQLAAWLTAHPGN